VPLDFSVVLLIDIPVKGTAFDWIKLHEDFRGAAKSVVEVVCWLLSNIDDPVEILKEEIR